MSRPEALVLLGVDEVLHLARRPAAIVDVEALQQSLDDALLVVGIDDLEVLRQPGFAPVTAQQPVGEAVEGADPQVVDGHAEQRLDTPAHLGRGLVGEGHGNEALRRQALDVDQPRRAVHEHSRLAASGAGNDQGRLGRGRDGLALRLVQLVENRGDVHAIGTA